MDLTEKEKWKAAVCCDAAYDGLFYYDVKTTGIFCRPSCKSKEALQVNAMYFDNAQEAYAKGLRPCKRCRPDLVTFRPTAELAEKAKQIYDACFPFYGCFS